MIYRRVTICFDKRLKILIDYSNRFVDKIISGIELNIQADDTFLIEFNLKRITTYNTHGTYSLISLRRRV